MLRKSKILSTLHQFPSKMYFTYLPSHIHTIFKRFSPPTCLLDFTFCPSSMFIPSNMFIRFCLFALPTLLFHPTRLLGTLEYLLSEVQEFEDEKTQVDFRFDKFFFKYYFLLVFTLISINRKRKQLEILLRNSISKKFRQIENQLGFFHP